MKNQRLPRLHGISAVLNDTVNGGMVRKAPRVEFTAQTMDTFSMDELTTSALMTNNIKQLNLIRYNMIMYQEMKQQVF